VGERKDQPEPADGLEVTPVGADPTADELLDLADLHLLHDRMSAVKAVEDAFDDRFATAELTTLQRGRRADVRGLVAANSGDDGVAEIAWTSALDLFAAAGDQLRRQATRARLGLLMCKTGRPEVGLPIATDATDYLISNAPPQRQCAVHRRMAFAYLLSGRSEEAMASLDEALAHASVSDDPHATVRLPVERAGMLAQMGRTDEAATVALAARDACRVADYRAGTAAICWILGRVAQSRGDIAAALEAYDEALVAVDVAEFEREIRRQRASMLASTPRAGEAIDDLVEEVAVATAEGEAEVGTTAKYHLAHAYINASRPLDAADVLEEIIATIEVDDPAGESVRHMLAQAYQMLDQPDQAIEQLEIVLASGASRAHLGLVGEMNEQIAQILDRLDRDRAAAARFTASSLAYQQADMVTEAVRAGRRAATSHVWARQINQAVEALDRVDRVALDLPADQPGARWERAMLYVDGARVLAQNEDLSTAIFRCAPAIGILTALGDTVAAAFAAGTYGEFLVRADRPAEAEPVLRVAFDEGNDNVSARAAQTLIQALEMLGRSDEAIEIRTRMETSE